VSETADTADTLCEEDKVRVVTAVNKTFKSAVNVSDRRDCFDNVFILDH
jgi:hypothetical protein